MPSAGRIRWAKFRVATLAVLALLILGVVVYLLTGGSLLRTRVPLYLYIPDATGLEVGAPVRVDGIDIGKVTSVRLSGSNDPNRVVYLGMLVDEQSLANVPADSYAQLSSDSLIGDQFVDITTGKSGQRLKPGSVIAYKPEPVLSKSLDLAQFQAQLRIVDATLRDIEERRNPLGQFWFEEGMYNDLRRKLRSLEKSMQSVRETSTTVGSLLFTDEMHRQTVQTLMDIDNSLAQLQAGQLLRDDAQYESLRKQAGDMRNSIQQMRAQGVFASDQTYTEWNRNLGSLIAIVDSLNSGPLMESSATYDNLNGAVRNIGESLKDFMANPKKYLTTKVF